MAEQQDGEDSNNLLRQNNPGGLDGIPSECCMREKGKKGGNKGEIRKQGKERKKEKSLFLHYCEIPGLNQETYQGILWSKNTGSKTYTKKEK